jgi:hypothetical protein
VGHVECREEIRKITKNLWENVKGKLRRRRTMYRREGNIKMDPKQDKIKLFISPTNAHKLYINCSIIKTIRIIKAAPTCFGLHKPSPGSYRQRLAKITVLVPVYV